MNLRPLTVARLGIYVAVAVAALSIWLGQRAGASLDYSLLRAVFVFVIFTALGFAAEAILTVDWQQPEKPAPAPPAADSAREEQV